MRRTVLLVLGAAVAAPLLASAPAGANPYCGWIGPVQAVGPICTVKCAMGLGVDPTSRPYVTGDTSCFVTD